MEGLKPERKGGTANSLRAGLLATGSLIALYEHGPARAAEIPREATWEQGVSELRRSAREDLFEHFVAFVQFSDGSSGWLPPIPGTSVSVNPDFRDISEQIAKMNTRSNVSEMCTIHTHTKRGAPEAFGLPAGTQLAYIPPGVSDITLVVTHDLQDSIIGAGGSEAKVKKNTIFSAVFDPTGVWYYAQTPATASSAQSISSDEYQSAITAQQQFIEKSLTTNFNFTNEFAALKNSYRLFLKADVRYVPYSELPGEPPCAGPEYSRTDK